MTAAAAKQTAKAPSALPDAVSAVALVGVLVFLASLPVVTTLAAGAAGAQVLREHADRDRTPTLRRFTVLFAQAVRDPVALLAPLAVVAIGVLDVLALLGGLPGAGVVAPVVALVLTLAVLCGLRAAGRWRPGARWADVLAEGATAVATDWRGDVLLVAALAVVGLIVSQAIGFTIIVPGLLVLAALAVEQRRPGR